MNHLSALAPIERELQFNEDKLLRCPFGSEEEIELRIAVMADRAFLNDRMQEFRPY